MKQYLLCISASIVMMVVGFFLGRDWFHPSAILSREERMADSIVLNSVYCRKGKDSDSVVRLALMDFLAFGGKVPPEDSSSDLLLVYLKERSSSASIEDFFRREFNGVESILKENCSIKNSYGVIMMIAGESPLVVRDYSEASDCKTLLESLEDKFVKYIWN